MNYQTLAVSLADGVANVVLNRPDKSNAMNRQMWDDIRDVFRQLDETPGARVVVLSGAGKHFNAGIDLAMLAQITDTGDGRDAHQREQLRRVILDLQNVITSLETCRKPVLAAIHGACIGAGVDLTCAADMRYCAADANFVIKEIELDSSPTSAPCSGCQSSSATAWRANWLTLGGRSPVPKPSRSVSLTVATARATT